MIQSQNAPDPNHQVQIEVENSNSEDIVYQTVDGQPINQPVVTEQNYTQNYHSQQTYQSQQISEQAEKSTDSYLEREDQSNPSIPLTLNILPSIETLAFFQLPLLANSLCWIACLFKNENRKNKNSLVNKVNSNLNCSVLLTPFGSVWQKVYKVDDDADGECGGEQDN